jgi:hypothetical protein
MKRQTPSSCSGRCPGPYIRCSTKASQGSYGKVCTTAGSSTVSRRTPQSVPYSVFCPDGEGSRSPSANPGRMCPSLHLQTENRSNGGGSPTAREMSERSNIQNVATDSVVIQKESTPSSAPD